MPGSVASEVCVGDCASDRGVRGAASPPAVRAPVPPKQPAAATPTSAAPAPAEATFTELTGTWQGVMNEGLGLGGAVRVAARAPAVRGLCRSGQRPRTGGRSARLVDRRERGLVRFEIKQLGGVFEGTVNPAKTLAQGKWTQPGRKRRRPRLPSERGRSGRRAGAKTGRPRAARLPSADGGAVHHAVHGARARPPEGAAQSRRFLPGLRAGARERRPAGRHHPGARCDRAATDPRPPHGHRPRRRSRADRPGHAGQRARPGRRRRDGLLVAALRQTRRCPAVRRPSPFRQRRQFRRAGDERSGRGRD